MEASRLRWLWSGWTVAAAAVLAVVGVLWGTHALQAQVQAQAERGATASARIIVALVVARNIDAEDVETLEVSAAEQTDMDDDIDELRRNDQVVDLDVWSLS